MKQSVSDEPTQKTLKGHEIPLPKRGDVMAAFKKIAKEVRLPGFRPGTAPRKVLEARIYGSPLEALCGEVFVPQKDATKLPLCGACKEIYDVYRAFNDGLGDTPQS